MYMYCVGFNLMLITLAIGFGKKSSAVLQDVPWWSLCPIFVMYGLFALTGLIMSVLVIVLHSGAFVYGLTPQGRAAKKQAEELQDGFEAAVLKEREAKNS